MHPKKQDFDSRILTKSSQKYPPRRHKTELNAGAENFELNSSEKIKIPKPLINHRKNKSNDYSIPCSFELPSVNEVLSRILHNSASPSKVITESKTKDIVLLIPKVPLSMSPAKSVMSKRGYSHKNHFRSASPLKKFNDRIFILKRLTGNKA